MLAPSCSEHLLCHWEQERIQSTTFQESSKCTRSSLEFSWCHLEGQALLRPAGPGPAEVPDEEAAIKARGCEAGGTTDGCGVGCAVTGVHTAAAKGDCTNWQPARQGADAAQAPVLGSGCARLRPQLKAPVLSNVQGSTICG